MTLTIVIPNYNNEKFLSRCIGSVLQQTRLPDEIIVVDDFSKDSSVSVIKEFEGKYPIVRGIYLEKNAGVSHARNTGILAATSEYITTLDADDFYFNEKKLENEMSLVEENPNIIAYSKLVYVNEANEVIRYVDYPKHHYLQGNVYEKLIAGFRENTIMRDYCFPKFIIEKAGLYDENSSLFEDYDLLIRLSRFLPAKCTFEYGTAYRIKAFGLSRRPKKAIDDAKKEIFNRYFKTLRITSKIKVVSFKFMISLKTYIKKIIGKK